MWIRLQFFQFDLLYITNTLNLHYIFWLTSEECGYHQFQSVILSFNCLTALVQWKDLMISWWNNQMQLFESLIIGLPELTYHRQAGWCSLEDYPFFVQQHFLHHSLCSVRKAFSKSNIKSPYLWNIIVFPLKSSVKCLCQYSEILVIFIRWSNLSFHTLSTTTMAWGHSEGRSCHWCGTPRSLCRSDCSHFKLAFLFGNHFLQVCLYVWHLL